MKQVKNKKREEWKKKNEEKNEEKKNDGMFIKENLDCFS